MLIFASIALSIIIFVLLIVGLSFAFRPGLVAGKVFVKLFKESPFFAVLSVIITFTLIVVSYFNWFYAPLSLLAICFLGIKIYEWADDRFLDDTIGGWIVKQKKMYFKIVPSNSSQIDVKDMENFLMNLNSTFENLSEKDLRTGAKFHQEYCIDLISLSGDINMYIKMYEKSLTTFVSAAKTHFPNVQFVEVESPYAQFPKTYDESKKIWDKCDITELSFAGKEKLILQMNCTKQLLLIN
jgi:hypothetical protein